MRILVTGDRNWTSAPAIFDFLLEAVWDLNQEQDTTYSAHTLVHGHARGVDTIADVIVQMLITEDEYFSAIERFPADWSTHGRAAGPIRNQQMLDSGVDYVVGFHNDILSSRGTRDMLRRCAEHSIPGRLFTELEEVQNWQQLVT